MEAAAERGPGQGRSLQRDPHLHADRRASRQRPRGPRGQGVSGQQQPLLGGCLLISSQGAARMTIYALWSSSDLSLFPE